MTILDYAETRNITVPAVHQAIKRYPDELEGHISTEGKKKILDQFAIDFLDSHIRLPSLVIDDKLALTFREREIGIREELVNAKNETITEKDNTRQEMVKHIDEAFEKLSQLQTAQYDDTNVIKAIERLEALISELKSESEKKDQRIAALESEKEQLNGTIKSLNTELNAMTDKYMNEISKSTFQKLFGKK